VALDAIYPRSHIRHFRLDSVVRGPSAAGSGRDTILLLAWGKEPDWSVANVGVESAGEEYRAPDEIPPHEVASLPRVTTDWPVWLVREGRRWHVTVEGELTGPLYLVADSIRQRCGWGEDARPCREQAGRLASGARRLRLAPWKGSLQRQAESVVQLAAALDSVTLERTREDIHGDAISFHWVVHNRGSRPLAYVNVRITDADGVPVTAKAFTGTVPPGGKESGIHYEQGRIPPGPFRYEIAGGRIDGG
jgi:hypothetical protein